MSHPIRGDKYSETRRNDLRTAKSILEAIRRECRRDSGNSIPTAPYLLYGETLEKEKDLIRLRIERANDLECDLLYVFGNILCPGMQAEVQAAERRGVHVNFLL